MHLTSYLPMVLLRVDASLPLYPNDVQNIYMLWTHHTQLLSACSVGVGRGRSEINTTVHTLCVLYMKNIRKRSSYQRLNIYVHYSPASMLSPVSPLSCKQATKETFYSIQYDGSLLSQLSPLFPTYIYRDCRPPSPPPPDPLHLQVFFCTAKAGRNHNR